MPNDLRFEFLGLDSWVGIAGFGFLGLETWAWIPGLGFLVLESWDWSPGLGFLDFDSWPEPYRKPYQNPIVFSKICKS